MPISVQINDKRSKHFEAIFYYANTGIVITDSNGKIAAINPFALKLFGYGRKELISKKIEILISPRFHKNYNLHYKKYLEKPSTVILEKGIEVFARKKDGTEFPAEVSLSNYNKNNGQFVIAFINNISARKKNEKEIEKLHAELEETVERRTKDLNKTLRQLQKSGIRLEKALAFQKAILNNAGAMIIVTDEKGIINIFNKEASVNIGYTLEQVIGKHSPVLFHDKKEIDRKRKELFREFGIMITEDFNVLVEKARRNIHAEEEFLYIRKNGIPFPVLLTITPIRSTNKEITGFMGVAIDISERKKAEDDLRLALEKEKELSELKLRFVSMASHEFRTPLSTVLSSAYLIEKYAAAEDQPKREKHIQRIASSINMLTDILNDFLSVGKIEEGKIYTHFTEFNIRELIIAIAAEMKSTLKKQQKIRYQHEGSPVVCMDASLLKHIIMNLVSNASKFSGEASPIEIKSSSQDNRIMLSVKDYGIGISREDQKHLMERFFRGANAGNIQGTGLGLHIVSKYAELMNGKVECKSELEKGTEILISFNIKTVSNEKDFADRRQ